MSEGNSELEIIRSRAAHGTRKRCKKKDETTNGEAVAVVSTTGEAPKAVLEELPSACVEAVEQNALGGPSALDEKKEPSKSGVVEVEVVKLCLNPRLVMARYKEGTVERVIKVKVGVNRNFRSRMKLALERPVDWESRVLPWEYRGRRPRLPGRW
jgi:hypothetical protein